MKHVIMIFFAAALLAGCATQQQGAGDKMNQSTRAKMTSCITAESMVRIENGTAFTAPVKATTDNIVETCLHRLALEKMGLNQEAATMTQTILSGLMAANRQ